MNKRKVPKIRFKGFHDDWEQRKLEDIYVERNERGNTELDILSVSIHHGISKNELGSDELGKSVRRSDDKSLYKHVYYGDLVFNMMRAWQGAIGVARNEGMVSPAYISAIPNGSIFPEYMDYCLRRKCIINQINNLSYGVTDFRKRLYWEPFTRVTIMMPSVDEQRKITGVLSRLDHLITLHQRKLEKLKIIKKSMLENCFPKNGEKAPKIRFSGFSDDWEQRKLDEFVSFFNGLTYSPKDIQSTGTLVLRSSNVKDGEVVDADNVYVDPAVVDSENVRDGDIIVVVRNGSRALIGKHAEIKGSKPHTVIGAFMTGIRSEHPSFLNALLNTPHFDKEVEMNMGATINQITGYMFSKMEFMVPSPEEQDAIGEFFKQLDQLITLHQSKLEKMKMIKKSMLETMFV